MFLRGLYAPYVRGKAPDPTGNMANDIFTPGLLGLIRKDKASAAGEVGRLDHDPICACQDYDALKSLRIDLSSTGRDATHAAVSFLNNGQSVTVGFSLVRTAAGWRIDDLQERGIASLRAFLRNG